MLLELREGWEKNWFTSSNVTNKTCIKTLRKLKDRNNLDTSKIDDVVLGCVHPIFEQGSNIARLSVLDADYDQSVPGTQLIDFVLQD